MAILHANLVSTSKPSRHTRNMVNGCKRPLTACTPLVIPCLSNCVPYIPCAHSGFWSLRARKLALHMVMAAGRMSTLVTLPEGPT